MKIAISCFQSLQKTSLEFNGFAVVTGESNLGKSALIRAVGGLIWGIPGDFYVRRGTSSCAVGVKFDDNLLVKWQKVPASKKVPGLETTLEINGSKNTKLGRDHSKLLEDQGFLSLPTAAGDFKPQIARQFDKAFLLDVPETVVAEVFKVLGRGDVVADARENARKDLGKNKSELAVRNLDLLKSKKTVDGMSWVRPLSVRVDGVIESLGKMVPKESVLVRVKENLAEQLPDVVPQVPAVKDLSEHIRLVKGCSAYQDIQIPEVPKVPSLGEKLRVLAGMVAYQDIPIPSIPKCEEPRSVSLLVRISGIERMEESLAAEGSELELSLKEAKENLVRMEKELGVCPTCGKEFGACDELQ